MTYVHYRVQNRKLVGNCCITEGSSLVFCDDQMGKTGEGKRVSLLGCWDPGGELEASGRRGARILFSGLDSIHQ